MMHYLIPDPMMMEKLGSAIASALTEKAPCILTLSGDLGAGKTTFVSGLLKKLGHEGPVKSPTFSLVETYFLQGKKIVHCDLYRVENFAELEAIGWRNYLADSDLILVEWPEKIGKKRLSIDLACQIKILNPTDRNVFLEAHSSMGQTILSYLSSSYVIL